MEYQEYWSLQGLITSVGLEYHYIRDGHFSVGALHSNSSWFAQNIPDLRAANQECRSPDLQSLSWFASSHDRASAPQIFLIWGVYSANQEFGHIVPDLRTNQEPFGTNQGNQKERLIVGRESTKNSPRFAVSSWFAPVSSWFAQTRFACMIPDLHALDSWFAMAPLGYEIRLWE